MIITINSERMVDEYQDKPHWGPQKAKCCVCGAEIGAYWSKWINMNTGEIMCGGLNTHREADFTGFKEWSDG